MNYPHRGPEATVYRPFILGQLVFIFHNSPFLLRKEGSLLILETLNSLLIPLGRRFTAALYLFIIPLPSSMTSAL